MPMTLVLPVIFAKVQKRAQSRNPGVGADGRGRPVKLTDHRLHLPVSKNTGVSFQVIYTHIAPRYTNDAHAMYPQKIHYWRATHTHAHYMCHTRAARGHRVHLHACPLSAQATMLVMKNQGIQRHTHTQPQKHKHTNTQTHKHTKTQRRNDTKTQRRKPQKHKHAHIHTHTHIYIYIYIAMDLSKPPHQQKHICIHVSRTRTGLTCNKM